MKYVIPNIGASIRRAREGKGWTQRQLAEAAGLTQARISLAERGADLTVSRLMQITGALDLEIVLVPRRARSLVEGVVESWPQSATGATSRRREGSA